MERAAELLSRIYAIHDNGGRPFKVIDKSDEKAIDIFARAENRTDYSYFKTYTYTKLWIDQRGPPRHRGNSVLVHIENDRYLYIGWIIFEFDAVEAIQDFHSDIGNNDVPYSYALTENWIYLLIEGVYISRDGNDGDPYYWYYETRREKTRATAKPVQAVNFEKTLVHNRLWL